MFSEAINVNNKFFENLKLKKLGIKRGFTGLFTCMRSMETIYKTHVSNGLLSYLLGYKFSQDHLETMFAVIRSKGGFNNNPNCSQFKAAFKRLIMRNQLTSSLNANCVNSEESFLHLKNVKEAIAKNSARIDLQFYDDVMDVWEDAFDEVNTIQLSEYVGDVVSYISGFVERTVKKRIKCDHCLNTLSKTDVDDSKLIKIKNRGGLTIPQLDIVNICKTAEQILWSSDISKPNFYNRLLARIMRQFVDKPIFRNMGHPNHIVECEHSITLTKAILNIYLKVRLHHIARQHNVNSKKKFLRSKCTKLIHFTNQ